MTPHRAVVAGLLLASSAVLGCSGEDFGSSRGKSGAPTYHEDVEPIVQRSCQGCHVDGGIAPFALGTYDDAKAVAGLMASQTASRAMPPWGAMETSDCTPRLGWKHDIRLSDEEIDLVSAWSKAGAPEGDPANAPPPIEVGAPSLPGVEMELAPAKPFVTAGDTDQFRCFVMDPGFTQPTFVNGTFVLPGNSAVVHHAVIFADPKRASEALADADGGYDCFGGVQVDDPQLVAVWTPGQDPFELPDNIGTPVAAGSLLVMQIHYHPAGMTAEPDLTRVQLRFNHEKPEYFLAPSTPIGNYPAPLADGDGLLTGPDFEIPANVANHVEEMRITIPATTESGAPLPDVWLYGAAAHMHYIGVDETIELEHATPQGDEPKVECLLHEPKWKFDWQRIYAYDAPIEGLPMVRGGDRIKVHCRYDNTLDNPGTARALSDSHQPAPVDVFLGEQTTDEMCLALLPLLYRAP